jgi:hypothetical protein
MPRARAHASSGAADPGEESPEPALAGAELRQVRAYGLMAGLSGIVFAALFVVALVLVQRAPGLGVPDSVYEQFYRGPGSSDVLVTAGLYVVPFAGLAFLWHLVATRTLIDASPGVPSKIPHGLHLVSGVLFVAMVFAGTAAVGAVALLSVFSVDPLPSADVARALSAVGYGLVFVFGVRAAGMYMITTTTLTRPLGLLPRWLVLLGYLAAAFLLVSTTFHPAILLVFPVWVVATSIAVLVRAGRAPP